MPARKRVLSADDEVAARLRREFAERGMAVVNLIGAPGSGKTALLERTLDALDGRLRTAVLVAGAAAGNDARRLARHGAAVDRILTTGPCHLAAGCIAGHLPNVDADDLDLLLIGNVGGLVRPSRVDLGEDGKVVVLSTTQAQDNPRKYPAIFHRAIATVLTKTDLVPSSGCDMAAIRANLERVHAGMAVFETSARTGAGIEAWVAWLEGRVAHKRAACHL